MSARKVSLAALAEDAPSSPATEPVGNPAGPPAIDLRDKPAKVLPGERVRFDDLERKETRLRADQYEDLSAASRRLNRARGGAGERITENTLIRVAIDMLLVRRSDLAGANEAELRQSVGL